VNRLLTLIGVALMAACALFGQGTGKKAPGPRLVIPTSPAAQLMLATPAQRERELKRFTPERQSQIRQQLAWFDSLPKEEQAIQIRRLERFATLLPTEKAIVRKQIQALNQLPPPRRQAVRSALTNLLNLTPEVRARRMKSPAFQTRFSPGELSIMQDLSEAWLPGLM